MVKIPINREPNNGGDEYERSKAISDNHVYYELVEERNAYRRKFYFSIFLWLLALVAFFFLWNAYGRAADDIDRLDAEVREYERQKQNESLQEPIAEPESPPPAGSPRVTPPPPRANPPPPAPKPQVIVDSPRAGSVLPNKVNIKGRAMNDWFFEANIVCILMDDAGRQIGRIGCAATTDWMKPGYVEFEGTMFIRGAPSTTPQTDRGTFIIENDNPSGDPANRKQHKVLVRFK